MSPMMSNYEGNISMRLQKIVGYEEQPSQYRAISVPINYVHHGSTRLSFNLLFYNFDQQANVFLQYGLIHSSCLFTTCIAQNSTHPCMIDVIGCDTRACLARWPAPPNWVPWKFLLPWSMCERVIPGFCLNKRESFGAMRTMSPYVSCILATSRILCPQSMDCTKIRRVTIHKVGPT